MYSNELTKDLYKDVGRQNNKDFYSEFRLRKYK